MNKLLTLLKGKPYLERWDLETRDDVKDLPLNLRKVGMSDFMLANGSWASKSYTTPNGNPTCWSFLASRYSDEYVDFVYVDGDVNGSSPYDTNSGVAPAFKFDLTSVASASSAKEAFGYDVLIDAVDYEDYNGKKGTYHTITFGSTRGFGKKADKNLSKSLEKALADGTLEKKNFQITGRMNDDRTFKKFDVYTYEGKEYAYVDAKAYDGGRKAYLDGSPIEDGEKVFIELKPATLIIRTPWEELPKYINPEGKGTATELVVRVQDAVNGGIPFSQKYRSVEYTSDDCDIRRYVENEFMQEFFIGNEQESEDNYASLKKQLNEILSEPDTILKWAQLDNLASLYESDAEATSLILKTITEYTSNHKKEDEVE